MRYLLLLLLFSCSTVKHQESSKLFFKLQNYQEFDFEDVKDSTIVIDLYNSAPKVKQSKQRIKALKENNNLIISYMSIGEAETYRPYYKNIGKDLILSENSQWQGNYTVKYWKSEWKKIIFNYTKEIIKNGFDGAYLDIVDCFHRFEDKKLYAKRMALLIIEINNYAKKHNKNFKLIIQNGLDIIDYLQPKIAKNFLHSIYGASLEAHLSERNKFKHTTFFEKHFRYYNRNNKQLFAIEYLKSSHEQKKFFNYTKQFNILPLVTDPKLKGLYYIHKSSE